MRDLARLEKMVSGHPLKRLSILALLAWFFLPTHASAELLRPQPADSHAAATAGTASVPDIDRDLARSRAAQAIRRSGASTEFPEDDGDRNYRFDTLRVREGSIARESINADLSGCFGHTKPPKKPGCNNGCQGCDGLRTTPDLQQASSILQILLVLALLALIGGLLYRVFVNRNRHFSEALQEHELVTEARGLHANAAEEAAERGDYNAAIHALFLQTLLRFSDASIAIRRDWTPREIPFQIAVADAQRAPLRELVGLAELARFAEHRSTAEEYEQARAAVQRIAAISSSVDP